MKFLAVLVFVSVVTSTVLSQKTAQHQLPTLAQTGISVDVNGKE